MKAKFNPKVSFYNNVFGKEKFNVNILAILKAIKNGRWQEQINEIRIIKDPKTRQEKKKFLPAFTASGLFSVRKETGLIAHSGLIQIDIDHIGAKQVEDFRFEVSAMPWTYAAFRSPSGDGLKVLFRIPANAKTHKFSFLAIEALFLDYFNINIDKACKDITRLFFVSFDPDLYFNLDAKVFPFFKSDKTNKKKTLPIYSTSNA